MYLDAVRNITIETNLNTTTKVVETSERKAVFDHWKKWQPSQISHHFKLCCEIAREWITATDFSALSGDALLTGPRWLRQKFKWGASSFPVYWCEAVRRDTLDCGALAALAHEVFTARGVRCHRVQLIQKFSSVATGQWTDNWSENSAPLPWIKDDLIYHEGCAIETEKRKIKVWDASAGWWVDSKSADGYGALLAIRLSGSNLKPNADYAWGEQIIKPNRWKEIV